MVSSRNERPRAASARCAAGALAAAVCGVLAFVAWLSPWGCGAHAPSAAPPASPRAEDAPAPPQNATRAEARPPSDDAGAGAPRFVGRFELDRSDGGDAVARFAWSGSTVEARFVGPSIAMRLRVSPAAARTFYGVSVDGAPPSPIAVTPDRERYELARGLDPGPHVVSATRDAEAIAGPHVFLGFELPEGGHLLPPRARPRRIEIVGDSITCGYGITGASAACSFSFETERASLAYGALLGRALDADVTTICWSGRGVLRNYDGTTRGTMPEMFELALPRRARAWDFSRAPQPDAVVVNLGTNDVLGGGGAPLDRPAFEEAFVSFLGRVRQVYPRAFVVVALSPMIEGGFRAYVRPSFERIVARRRAMGDRRVELLVLEEQGSRLGCDAHPNLAMHRVMADAIAEALRPKLDAGP